MHRRRCYQVADWYAPVGHIRVQLIVVPAVPVTLSIALSASVTLPGCVIRRIRAPIPIQAGRVIRGKLDTRAGTNARLEEMRGWLILHIGRLSLPVLAPVSLAHPLTVYEHPPQAGIARLLCIAAVCLAQEQGYGRSRESAFRRAVWAARIRFEYAMRASSTTARRTTSVYGTTSRRARPKAA